MGTEIETETKIDKKISNVSRYKNRNRIKSGSGDGILANIKIEISVEEKMKMTRVQK